MGETQNQTCRSTNRSKQIVVSLFLLLVVYPLSIGPVAWIDRNRILPKPVMDVVLQIYFPIDWMYDHSVSAREILDRYFKLWR